MLHRASTVYEEFYYSPGATQLMDLSQGCSKQHR